MRNFAIQVDGVDSKKIIRFVKNPYQIDLVYAFAEDDDLNLEKLMLAKNVKVVLYDTHGVETTSKTYKVLYSNSSYSLDSESTEQYLLINLSYWTPEE